MVQSRPLHRYTYADYVALESDSSTKHEFLDGEIYAMAGGSEDHSALAAEVLRVLGNAVADGPCRTHTSDLRIYVEATGLATFPDGAVICGALQQHAPSPVATALNPTVLLEVTRDSSEEYDTGTHIRNVRHVLAMAVIVFATGLGFGCSTKQENSELEKQLVGVWSFNPREQLPSEAIDDVSFVTSDRIILDVGAASTEANGGRRGDYSLYRHTPKSKHAPAHWDATHAKWFVHDGKLMLQGDVEEEVKATPSDTRLTLEGLIKLPCKGGCRLERIAAVPAALKEACKQPSDARPGKEMSCAR